MYTRQFLALTFFTLFYATGISAQVNSSTTIDSSRFNGPVNTIIVQPDGKIIIGGNFTTYNKLASRCIARLNADGSLDKSFITGTGFNYEVNVLALQPDGKVIAGGKFSNYNGAGNSCNRIVRLNSDGRIDKSFNISIGFQGNVMALALQQDGKVIVGGMLARFNGIQCGGLVRLNANGSLDQNFV
ncbi:MAG: delta-60 repeat domain-containing protein [Ginsengibacter sp.]